MAIALLTKEEFTSLYKYGHVQLSSDRICYKEDFEDAIKQVLSSSDSFEFAQERLFVNASTIVEGVLHIKDLVSIHTIDRQSKSIYETQFHKNLIFGDPIPEYIFNDWYQDILIERDTIDGINAFRTICGLPEETNEDFVKDIVKGRIHRKNYKYFDVPLDERGIWDMLVAYDRYGHYGNDSKGNLLDLLDVLIYSTQKKEKYLGYSDTAIEGQTIYSKINNLTGRGFAELIERLKCTEGTEKFIDSATSAYGDIKIPISFLFLKEKFRNEDDWRKLQPTVKAAREFCQDQFGPVASLIGGFFGYDRFYDNYYEALNLAVLKSSKVEDIAVEQEPKQAEDLLETDTNPIADAPEQHVDIAINKGQSPSPEITADIPDEREVAGVDALEIESVEVSPTGEIISKENLEADLSQITDIKAVTPVPSKEDTVLEGVGGITGLFEDQITGDIIFAAYSSVVSSKTKLTRFKKFLSNPSKVEYIIELLKKGDNEALCNIADCTKIQLPKILKKINI